MIYSYHMMGTFFQYLLSFHFELIICYLLLTWLLILPVTVEKYDLNIYLFLLQGM